MQFYITWIPPVDEEEIFHSINWRAENSLSID